MISGVILARNEEDNIVDCINRLRPHVSELILIDMESNDRTASLARPLVDKILPHQLIPNFDSARNVAVSEVNNDWLWFVDADERISPTTGNLVRTLVAEKGDCFDAINIPFKTYFCGKWMQHSGWWPGYTMPRVLRRGRFRFSERLHGGVELSGCELRIAPDPASAIDHFSYSSIEHYIEKLNRYTSTEAMHLQAGGQSIDWRNAIAHMVSDLWQYYERNEGKSDGRHGWLLAWLSGQYRWLSHAKLLDLDSDKIEPNAELIPDSLDDVIRVMQQELERLRKDCPESPLGVVWRSPIFDFSGYADEGRCIAKALCYTGRNVVLDTIAWRNQGCGIPQDDQLLFRLMENVKRSRSNIAITNGIPACAELDTAAAINIIRTTFEADRIPNSWLSVLEQYDEIWVISNHNKSSFIRSGVPPEKIRCVPSFLDTGLFKPSGPKLGLPAKLKNKFVFLSVLDWQLRKGWDLLLKAYCQTFSVEDEVGLVLKVSRFNEISSATLLEQANSLLKKIGQELRDRIDIVFLEEYYSAEQMASLYRSANAFVLPSRGEGWGRPYMEAMATGLPTIGTEASGNLDFMDSKNSILIPAKKIPVPDDAVAEVGVYEGSMWFEPDLEALCESMTLVVSDNKLCRQLANNGVDHVRTSHGLTSGARYFGQAIDSVEKKFIPPVEVKNNDCSGIPIVWEGEFFADHSFSNINEQLAPYFLNDNIFDFSILRRFHNTSNNNRFNSAKLFPCMENLVTPEITVRHAYPPNWNPPETGKWVHIQPWEYGHLPQEWINPLENEVDEIWVPSSYVKQVYMDSGISQNKVHVIPWGVDLSIFNPHIPARLLPTQKSFKFIFVGGTIRRKGFDRLLNAYVEEFSPDEDVCLVVKDLGADSFYRFGNQRQEILNAISDRNCPEIIYYDELWTPGQVASLYNACHCLVMPYRGEGFGLPILEAMACGVPPIVPSGGASDDFVNEAVGIKLEAQIVFDESDRKTVGPITELEIENGELKLAMRMAFENSTKLFQLSQNAKHHAKQFTWINTYELMRRRILENVNSVPHKKIRQGSLNASIIGSDVVSACITTSNNERELANCLSRLKPYFKHILVLDKGSSDRTAIIAKEYGALVVENLSKLDDPEVLKTRVKTDWFLQLVPSDLLAEEAIKEIELFVKSQPKLTSAATLQLPLASTSNSANPKPISQVRIIRTQSL